MLARFRLDLNSYKENQLKRRMDSLIVKLKFNDYGELFNSLIANHSAYEAFLDHLTINVSEFFRDPRRWSELEKRILPEILVGKDKIRIWSAACSFGAEPYSLGIVLNELSPNKAHLIDATDLDKTILETAQIGGYNDDAIKNVGQERKKYFYRHNNKYHIDEKIKNMVSFRRHDLLTDEYKKGYDLIVCRNVTIYFTREAQDKINNGFSNSLNKGGYLFIGGSEIIFNYRELGFEKKLPCFYKKL